MDGWDKQSTKLEIRGTNKKGNCPLEGTLAVFLNVYSQLETGYNLFALSALMILFSILD